MNSHMDAIVSCIAIITTVYLLLTLIELQFGFRAIKNLSRQPFNPAVKLPSVSIIFSALNEEEDIECAVKALLKMEYPDFEVIAINDRSRDKTGEILNALQARYPQLKVQHITELPSGWLGKNHALYQGSKIAGGEWLLFTDADVIMKPDTLTRSLSYCMEHQVSHLTICEKHVRNTFPLKILLLAQYILVSMALKPWRIRFTWSRRSIGFGAFNLVQKSAYVAAGTHKAIALECLDDLKLGALLKRHAYQQDTVDGRDFIERQWYATLPDMLEGWKKNTYAFFEYRFSWMLGATIFALLLFWWPILALFFCGGAAFYLNIINISLTLLITASVCANYRMSLWFSWWYPPAVLLLIYSIWNSAIAIYRQGGVVWRGTHYPLTTLRGARLFNEGIGKIN